jgi:enoyl-CoA hydratase/carnithine racemase
MKIRGHPRAGGGKIMAETNEGETVLYECTERIATITFNRPDKLNAFDDNQVRRLGEALRRFDTDPAADVAILCGRGRAFSSGADVQQRQLRTREEFERLGGPQAHDANAADLLTRSVNWKPVIAAAHGYVMGLGLGLLLECDLIVAEQGTQFQVTETGRGLGGARHWGLLQSRGGGAIATEVALTGRFFSAEEALSAGIINRVASAGKHLDIAMELAREIVKVPPLSVRATVRTRRWYMDKLSREIMMQTQPLKLYLTEDFQEAASAFAEKRPAKPFKGR